MGATITHLVEINDRVDYVIVKFRQLCYLVNNNAG
jgi:hypothetical protein